MQFVSNSIPYAVLGSSRFLLRDLERREGWKALETVVNLWLGRVMQ